MWKSKKSKPHWVELTLLIAVFIAMAIWVVMVARSVGVIRFGDGEPVAHPEATDVITAVQTLIATSGPAPTNIQIPAETSTPAPTEMPPQGTILEVRETDQSSWIEFSREDAERVFSFVGPDAQKHRLFGFCLGRNCSRDPEEDANALLIYLRKGDPIPSAKIEFYELILIEWNRNATVVRIDRKGNPQWLEPANDGLDVGDYAVVNIYIYSGGLFEIGYNQNPSSHSLVE